MAETVQYALESMIPELEDLEEKHLFVKQEIQSIVKKRTKLEYALRRPSPKKTDFLKYIEYELNLEALRKKRKARLIGRLGRGDTSVSDFAGMRRINFLFERTVRRYHGDVAIWVQYAEFAKSQSSPRLLSRVLVRALQYHPGKAELWIMAAKWEFDGNLNIVAARSLMQRGLRLIPSSEAMWHAYHGLELAYVVKLIHRRRIL
ncbi:U3 small nucleolar RNA-associated protein 6-domain-containing protein, partial [Piptocephalis cylindrospora]